MSLAIYFDRLCQHIEKNSLRGFATFWWQILVVNLLGTSQNKHASEARELSSPFLSQLHHILRGTRLSWCQYWFLVHSAKSCTGPCKDQSDVQTFYKQVMLCVEVNFWHHPSPPPPKKKNPQQKINLCHKKKFLFFLDVAKKKKIFFLTTSWKVKSKITSWLENTENVFAAYCIGGTTILVYPNTKTQFVTISSIVNVVIAKTFNYLTLQGCRNQQLRKTPAGHSGWVSLTKRFFFVCPGCW